VTATILKGGDLGRRIEDRVRENVAELAARHRAPGLAVLLVGENPASKVYVRRKGEACERVGIDLRLTRLPEDTREEEILRLVDEANSDDGIDGILVQLPLPKGVDEDRVIQRVAPKKDVDGFHAANLGRLMQGRPRFLPCTVAGILEILKDNEIPVEGRRVVVVGRSLIVGLPLANALLKRGPGGNATVTVCHSRTPDLGEVTRRAEILIVAAGQPALVTGEMVSPGAVVIDVGVNRVEDPSKKKGYRLCGDVDFDSVIEKAAAITPVPGGVGPLTVSMLMENTLRAARMRMGEEARC
jgi:methylenetetrahydrofolate dehydrogenase (NADP+)/methenyltetrahydrofolate cyclohydrolase